jgi:DNA-binding MarR family transcriptional regulator
VALELKNLPDYEKLVAMQRRFEDAEPAAIETCLLLLRVASDLFTAFDAHFTRHGISRGRFMVLINLMSADPEPVRPGELAERTGVTGATISGLLKHLEADGLIARAGVPEDRRRVTVRLTESGRTFLRRLLPDHFRRVRGLMGGLSDKQKETLARLLRTVRDGIPAVREP